MAPPSDPTSPDASRAPLSVAPWWPAAIAAVLAPAFLVRVKDPDVWWHLATGRWMVANGRLPTTDPFTYTMAGKPWHLVNGLADLIFYAAYRLGAAPGLVVLKAVCAFATLSLVGLCLREVRVSNGGIAGLLVAVAVLLHGRYSLDRPLILGAVLLAAAQLAVLRSHARRDRSHLFFLVALPLWPLVHATALLGVAQLGALLVAGIVARAPRAHLRRVALTFAGAMAITVLLPWWRSAYVLATQLTGGATATLFTAEWRTGAEAVGDRVGHWALVAAAIVGGVRRRRENAALLLLALLAAVLSVRFARNAYEGVILAAPAAALALVDAAAWVRARGAALVADAVVPVGALAMAVAQFVAAPLRTINGPFGLGVSTQMFPYDTVATLRRLPAHRLFNDFPTGGFLIWEDGPWGVFCDGRTVALYTEADVQALFVPMIESDSALTRTADAWDAPYGLNENLSPPNQWMMVSREWVPIHIGVSTTLFVRSTHLGELPEGVRPLSLVRITSDGRWMAQWYGRILRDPQLRAQLADEIVYAAVLSPESPALVDVIQLVAALSPGYGAELSERLTRKGGGR